jgi:AmmeMemoRadiSam system protein B
MGPAAAKGKSRPTIVDGIFYPAQRAKLRAQVESLLSRSKTPEGRCFAVVSPHAGYSYAGDVIAAAFRAIQLRQVKTAVLIGPVHRDPLEGIFLPESEEFATPIGTLNVDMEAVHKLASFSGIFTQSDLPHLEEHCIEVQLPFIAHMFPEASIVPLLIGEAKLKTIQTLSEALRLTFQSADDYTVFIASANMASYMRGTDMQNESEAMKRLIAERDWRGIASAVEKGGISSCGTAGIAALLCMGGDGLKVELLAEADSRAVDGDRARGVHYASFGLDREE